MVPGVSGLETVDSSGKNHKINCSVQKQIVPTCEKMYVLIPGVKYVREHRINYLTIT